MSEKQKISQVALLTTPLGQLKTRLAKRPFASEPGPVSIRDCPRADGTEGPADFNDLAMVLADRYPKRTFYQAMTEELLSHHPSYDRSKEPWAGFTKKWLAGEYSLYEYHDAYVVRLRGRSSEW